MDEKLNHNTVLVYLEGAREALHTARYNLDGGYYRIARQQLRHPRDFLTQRRQVAKALISAPLR